MNLSTALCCSLLMAASLTWPAQAQTATPSAPPDYSAAERLLLMSRQLDALKPPTRLGYRFTHAGSQDAPFTDRVNLQVDKDARGRCCTAVGEFLTGARKVQLPEIEQAEGNPVILYFLEHDIREMNRLTKGSTNYFRKRIRMALYNSASLRETTARYQGRTVAAKEISIQPYLDDPNRARFEQYTRKRYVFVLSDAVPGAVISIRSVAPADGQPTPLVDEELLLDGAETLATATTARL